MREEIKRNLIVVNSRDKISGSNSDFLYSLGDNSLDIEAISLKSASIPHTYTNINETNNTFGIQVGLEIVLATADSYQASIVVNGIEYTYNNTGGHVRVYTQQDFIDNVNNSTDFAGQIELSWNGGLGRYELTSLQNVDPGSFYSDRNDVGTINLWTELGFVMPIPMNPTPTTITATNPPSATFAVGPSVDYTITVDPAQYDINSLIAELSVKIPAVLPLGTWTLTIAAGGKVSIQSTAYSWDFVKDLADIPHMLGYEPSLMTTSPTHVASGVPDLYGTRYLYVASTTLANGYNCIQKRGLKTSILGNVPVCSTQGGIDKWEANYPIIKKYDQSVNVNQVDIQILDDANNPIPLEGADVVLVFEVWCTVRL